MSKREILPQALYSAAEVAALLGLGHANRVYEIPEAELVPTRVGARRGRKMFRGVDVLAYLSAGRKGAAA
jgi:hypothetical protein